MSGPLLTEANPARLSIPSLNGLRFAAIALVFVNHAGLSIDGGVGVTAFFFLSGYLITTLMRLEQEKRQRVDVKAFYLRRTLRILPPLYAVVAVATVLGASHALLAGTGTPSVVGVLAELFHFTNYYEVIHGRQGLPPGTNQMWSLAVEEHFYLLFPLVFVWLSRRPRNSLWKYLVGAIVVITLWRILVTYGFHGGYDRVYLSTDTRMDSLLFGCVLALHANPAMGENRTDERLLKYLLFPAALVAMAYVTLEWSGNVQLAFSPLVVGLALYPVFATVIRFPTWGIVKILNWRFIDYLGVLSYSAYLCHHLMLFGWAQALPAGTSDVVIAIPAALCTVAASHVMHVMIEQPSNRLRHRLEAVRTPDDSAVAIPGFVEDPQPSRALE